MRLPRKSLWLFFLAALFLLFPTFIDLASDRSGEILVAKETVSPPFDRTVVLIQRQNLDGAEGVILNRPLTEEQKAGVPAFLKEKGIDVGYGGPVDFPDKIYVLEEIPSEGEEGVQYDLNEWDVAVKAAPDLLERLVRDRTKRERRYRVFIGYAGWGPFQLYSEIRERGIWYSLPAAHDIVFQKGEKTGWQILFDREKETIDTSEPRFGD